MYDFSFDRPIDAVAGRVTKILLPEADGISAVSIDGQPQSGRVTLDPDGRTLSYVAHDPAFTGTVSVSLDITRDDGTTETLTQTVDVVAGPQLAGWSTGESLYMLRTDDNDEVIVETGANHRKVYVTDSDLALSKEEIEEIEGVAISDNKFGEWLANHPEYGASEDLALDPVAGKALWSHLTGVETEPSSHWLLLERGYEYSMGRLIDEGTTGESPLHPIHVTAWGVGDPPDLVDRIDLFKKESSNIVFSDLETSGGFRALGGENILLEDVHVTGHSLNIQNVDGFTFRQGEVIDVIKDAPADPDGWTAHQDRAQGIFANRVDGLLIEDSFIDHTGWADGYDADGDAAFGQAPSQFSQNIYLQKDNEDLTFRDNISMRAASAGAQIRSGGLIEDNVFIDNNFGFSTGHGNKISDDLWSGNYTLANGNLVTSAGNKDGLNIGARSLGISDYSKLSVYVDNIVAHLANPDDPDDYLDKKLENDGISGNRYREYDDTIVRNWDTWSATHKLQEANTDGLDLDRADATTIQRYAADLLGRETATIEDLAVYLRDLTGSGGEIDADAILDYFRDGFGFDIEVRDAPALIGFVPDELGDGVRWDNRVNWTTEGLPTDGDAVDLRGNLVHFGGTVDLVGLSFGAGGTLSLNHGLLEAGTVVGGGEIRIDDAGQFWLGGWDGEGTLDVDIDGGRFANTGTLEGAFEIDADDGQVVLATAGGGLSVTDGTITLSGDDAQVGFDGTGGTGSVRLEEAATLRFVAEADGLGTLTEFRSGAFGTPDLVSNLIVAGATLEIDVAALAGGGSHDLVLVDNVMGTFGQVTVTGLGARDAQVHVDHAGGTVTLRLTDGSGQVRTSETTPWDPDVELPRVDATDTTPHNLFDGTTGVRPAPAPVDPVEDVPDTPEYKPSVLPEDRPVIDPVVEEPTLPPATETVTETVITGREQSDRIFGSDADERINGHGGRDWIKGGDGDDAIYGGTGRDELSGQTGNDRLFGGAGRDRLNGGDGDDLLNGGDGSHDILIGGDGADTFVFDLSADTWEMDRIEDFDASEGDLIVIQGLSDDRMLSVDERNIRSIVEADDADGGFNIVDVRGEFTDLQVIEQGAGYAVLG